ncbi:hypothetical protein QP735_04250 [Curtobacterium citreum]|uniref:hypothetical protein n=1 Tax=Curtobacterium citreum TaxID=2036 RepID=UPI00254FA377|nr:hypothetical protein [Curtobacterium citreum]MDK8171735.1 hypothetical protein [Curtobacterium citreum]
MTESIVLTTRAHLVDVLINHQRVSLRSCGCGWDALGKSHAEHIADMVQEVEHD